jgi:hypothetical protein
MRLEVEPHQSNRSPHDFPTIQTAMFMDSGEAVNHLYDNSKSHQLVRSATDETASEALLPRSGAGSHLDLERPFVSVGSTQLHQSSPLA